MKVLIYYQHGNKRSAAVTNALQAGIAQCQGNESVLMLDEANYTNPISADVVCFYGLSGNFMKLFNEYRAKETQTVFFDLGIWGRKGDPQPDFHRVAINGYMPTSYFHLNATPERFFQFGKTIKPWRNTGTNILVVGMSERAAKVWGLGSAREHAAAMIAEVRKHTARPIVYTAKSSNPDEEPIPGVQYFYGPILEALRDVWCVVTHRSHAAVDGLIEGVPCIVLGDHPALFMSHNDLARIEDPLRLDDPARLQFCSDAAWHQYSLREMRSGYMWKIFFKFGWLKS